MSPGYGDDAGSQSGMVTAEWIRWLTVVKERIESQSAGSIEISASQVTSGVFDPARIPDIPFTRIQMTARHLLGRTSDGLGDAEEIQVGLGLTLAAGLLRLTPVMPTAPIVIGFAGPLREDDAEPEAAWAYAAASSARGLTGATGATGLPGLDGRDAESGDDPWAFAAAGAGTFGPFTSGSVIFAGPGGLLAQDNANLFWDNATKRLGIGTIAPSAFFAVKGAGGGSDVISVMNSVGNTVAKLFTTGGSEGGGLDLKTNAGATNVHFDADVAGSTYTMNFFGIGLNNPTARLHLTAGTATAGTAPLKFTSGTLLTAPAAGAVEFLTDTFHGTITTGAARKAFVLDDGARLTSGKVPVATTNGRLIDSVLATSTGGLAINGVFNLKNFTVATLPAGTRGDTAYVTDGLAPAFLVAIAGGGATVTPVFFDGANWVAM